MTPAENSNADSKYPRMHQLALTMYRSGDYSAALKIWRRLKEQKPDFPDIDAWIQRAAKPPYPATTQKPQTDPTVFRTQRELMSRYGNIARRRSFHPRNTPGPLYRRFRDRNLVYTFLILFVFFLLLSIRNNRTYAIRLNPESQVLDCYQGNFFPLGMQKTSEIKVGIDSDWAVRFKNRELIRKLENGIRVHSLDSFDQTVIDIYMALGDDMLKQMTIRSQQSAIYYYKRIESAQYRHRVAMKLAEAFVNLATMALNDGQYQEAREYYETARSYDPSHPDLFPLRDSLGNINSAGLNPL
ncbi:MAG TPA: tetratricopeptide repeat protein [bacterium]|nr:tetratricopeptide repeat protein [bacterium]